MKFRTVILGICLFTFLGQVGYGQPTSSSMGTFYGGGIGFVGSFEVLGLSDWPQELIRLTNVEGYPQNRDNPEGTDIYTALGINGRFGNSITFYGGEGFGQVTEHVRLSGVALFGSQGISEYDEGTDQTRSVSVDIVKSALNVEYVFQMGRNVQFGVGGGFGLGRVNLTVFQMTGSSVAWERVWLPFSIENDYPNPSVDDLGFRSATASGIFFFGQPIASIKYQISSWIGIRLAGGYQIGRVGENSWELNGQYNIVGAESMSMMSPFFRGMIYFGI